MFRLLLLLLVELLVGLDDVCQLIDLFLELHSLLHVTSDTGRQSPDSTLKKSDFLSVIDVLELRVLHSVFQVFDALHAIRIGI